MTFDQIQQLSLREQVVRQIRTAIIEGRLRPGDHIVESRLTEQLGVSRTPVREALILLEREGLVLAEPNRGSFVRAFTERDVIDLFSMRTTLENFAAERSVQSLSEADFAALEDSVERQQAAIESKDIKEVRSIDMDFHRYLVERSNHTLLIRGWEELVAQIAALLYLRAEAVPNYDEYLAIRDHTSIIDAYRRRDLSDIKAANRRINERVSNECVAAVRAFKAKNA